MKNNLSFIVQRNAHIYIFIGNLIKHFLSRILFFTNEYYVDNENYSFSKI